nr:unnamed protein product [Callosobruchus analis]
MPSHHKCAVKDCQDTVSVCHRFLNPRKYMSVFEQSINIVGNEAIRILDPIAVYNNYRVCHAHLTEDDNYTNNRLEKDAVPTVNLPAPRICALSEQIMDMLFFFQNVSSMVVVVASIDWLSQVLNYYYAEFKKDHTIEQVFSVTHTQD